MTNRRFRIRPGIALIRWQRLDLLALPLSFLLALLLSCSEDSPTALQDDPSVDSTVTILESTVVIPAEEAGRGLVVYSENGEITMTRAYVEDQGIEIGSVLVSGINALAPHGFLRAVTSVREDGEHVVLETEQASLTDAIEKGQIRANLELDRNSTGPVWVAEGVEYTPDKGDLSTQFTFRVDTVVFDQDGDYSTRDDQVRLTGQLVLKSGLEFEIDIDVDGWLRPTLTRMLLASYRTTEATLSAQMGSRADLVRPIRRKIADIPGGSVTIPAGPIPIVVVLRAEVFLEVGITGTVSVQFGYSMNETVRSGSEYRNGRWYDFDESDKTVDLLSVSITGNVEARAGVVSRASMTVYGVAGPYIAGETYSAATASATLGSQGLELGIEIACVAKASLGFLVRVFSRDLVDIAAEWELWRLVILERTSLLNSYPVACFSVTPSQGTPETLFEVNASCSSDREDPTAALEIRWDWDNDGVWDTEWNSTKTASHRYITPGTRRIRLEVRDTGEITHTTTREVTVVAQPVCRLSEASLDFGSSVAPGSAADRSFTITNAGGGTLTGSVSLSGSHYSIVSGSGSYSLTTGQSRTVTVRFTAPSAAGVHTCTVNVGSACGTVSGAATVVVGPSCTLSTRSLTFGSSISPGAVVDRSFTITNTGGGTLTGSVSLSGSHYSIVSGSGSYSLTTGQSRTVTVRFTAPSSAGVHTCTLNVGSACGSVSGTATVVAGASCSLSTRTLDFGSSIAPGTTVERSFTITNTGGGTLTGSVSRTCFHYSLISGGGPYTLGPGQSRTVTVRFNSTWGGTHTCDINAGTSCGTVVGTATVVVGPYCFVDRDFLYFGAIAPGSTAERSFTITNAGDGALTGTVSLNCPCYQVIAGGGAYSLGANQSRSVTVRFTAPSVAGDHSCTVHTGAACYEVRCSATVTGSVGTPVFSPAPGSYANQVSVSINCGTLGATIRYTTDGSTPTEGSPLYSTPVLISSTTTLRARAWKRDMSPSQVQSGVYTITSDEQYRIVLTWGASPRDLDSHLWVGGSYHVYYDNRGSATSPPYAELDVDDTQGGGPETITIHRLTGPYKYAVHNFSGSPSITESDAVVRVYRDAQLVRTFTVPREGTGLWWYVFDMSPSGQITTRNYVSDSPPGHTLSIGEKAPSD